MFVGSFFVFVTILTSVYGTCQSLDGQSVPWWILYQQKERPFFHQYVDSTNSHRVKDHYPERRDSVLSRVMSSVIDKEEAEYIIYSSDLVNVKDIAGKTSIPTYSKWMHGILGTVSSWDSGFWILHNNLLFPALNNGVLAEPGSKAWYATTVGDNSADLFYICLTADNRGNITEMLTSIMAGNPFIYKRKLHNGNFLQPYLKEVRPLQTSFGYEMSAAIFMDCMYTQGSNVSTNCLFTYAVTTGVGINVFTRPRGMIHHSSAFCYDDQSGYLFDFLKLEKGSTLRSGFSHTMFAFSDKTDSSVGITCFGQDVAANAETVGVMICANLPEVHINVIKLSRLTQWSCKSVDSSPDKRNMHNKGKAKHSSDFYSDVKQPQVIATQEGNDEDNKEITDVNIESDKKDAAKFCLTFECDNNNAVKKEQDQFHFSHLKNPLLKNKKLAHWFNEMVNDITMEHNIDNPKKIEKLIKQEKNAFKVKGSLEVSRFLLKNERAVLGLFCQEGCRFCQNAREQFVLLANSIQLDDLDFVIVNIKELSLPDDLKVPYTPYVRYKFYGQAQWIDYSGNIFDIQHIVTFLHYTTTYKRFRNDKDVGSVVTGDIITEENDQSNMVNERNRRDTRELSKVRLNTSGSTKEAHFRIKRTIHDDFKKKHLWENPKSITAITEKDALGQLLIVNKGLKNKRRGNTFIVTNNMTDTIDQINSITKNYFANFKYSHSIDNESIIYFFAFNIMDIHAKLIHVEKQNTKNPSFCGYTAEYMIVLGAVSNTQDFLVNHFDSKVHEVKQSLRKCTHSQLKRVKGFCYVNGVAKILP